MKFAMRHKHVWFVIIVLFLLSALVFGQTPQTAAEYLKRGIAYQEDKKYLPALDDFNKAIELDPKLAEAYYHRGMVQLEKEKAIADYSKAIELKPDYAEAYFQRGLS